MSRRSISAALVGAVLSLASVVPSGGAQSTDADTGCPGTDVRATAENLAASRTALRCLLDAERARRDLPPYRKTAALQRAADRHARDMTRQRYFSHTSKNGRRLCDRVRATGYLRGSKRRYHLGETLVYGINADSTPARLADTLLGSPAHRRLLLLADLRDMGVGLAAGLPLAGDSRAGATVVIDLGRRVGNSSKSFKGAKTCAARASST